MFEVASVLTPGPQMPLGFDEPLPARPLPTSAPADDAPERDPTDETIMMSKIMIVDDDVTSVKVLKKHLQSAGYQYIVTTAESTSAMKLMRRENPDVVLLDLLMPNVSGLDILRERGADAQLRYMPVIMLTAATDVETKQQALRLGATDYLSKPVDDYDLTLRVRNALVTKCYQNQLANQARQLEQAVQKRTAELAASREEVILCLARAGEFRDNETGNHVVRVGRFVGVIAHELGYSEDRVKILEQAAQLHDVGKIGIPDEILLKPGRLDPEEYEFMQRHCLFGRKIIERMPASEMDRFRKHSELGARLLNVQSSPVLGVAALIALTHHEWWDGSGYPLGLAGEDIPLEGRMAAVADVYDALSTKRPYKNAIPRKECFAMMEKDRGKHFDPKVLDAFFRRRQEIIQIQIDCADMV